MFIFPHHPRGDGSVFNRWVVRARGCGCGCARVCPQCPLRYIFLRKLLKSWPQNCPATAAEKKCPRRLPPKGKYVLRRFSENATEVHKLFEQRELYSERLSRPAENFVRQDVNFKKLKNFQKISKISKKFKNFKKSNPPTQNFKKVTHVMLCYVMLCYAMLCYAMLCYVMSC